MKNRIITWGILGVLVMVVGWHLWSSRAVTLGPGPKAFVDPIQTELQEPSVIRMGDISVMPLAEFQIRAKVLSRKRYWWGKGSQLCPVDLALGWGPMSDEKVLESIDISQSGRWYRWKASTEDLPISIREVETHSANMHIIPADKEVRKILKSVRKGQIVIIDGYLVRCHDPNGWRWKSSLSREDTGGGACEIVYAKEITISAGG